MKSQGGRMGVPPVELDLDASCITLRVKRLQKQVADIHAIEVFTDGKLAGLLGCPRLAAVQLGQRQVDIGCRVRGADLDCAPGGLDTQCCLTYRVILFREVAEGFGSAWIKRAPRLVGLDTLG